MKTNIRRSLQYLGATGVLLTLLAACGPTDSGTAEDTGDAPASTEMAKIPVTTASDEARNLYMQGRQLADDLLIVEANDLFVQAVAVDDSFAMGHYMAALTAQSNADFFDAIARANDLQGNASEGEQLIITASFAASENDQVAQQAALEELLALYPGDERAHVGMANFLNVQQDFAGAAAHFEHAVQIAPEFASAHNSLGYAYRTLEDFDKSRASFERYVELIPDEANPYDSLAELLMEMGNYDESIENYRKALAINEYFAASYAGLTINYSLKGETDLAQEAADQMLAAARNFGERQGALFRSITSHLFAGNIDAAMDVAGLVYAEAEVEGNHSVMGGITEYMGDIMMVTGEATKAEEYFDSALDHRLQADVNEASKSAAARAHLFKTAIAAMIGGESEIAAGRTAEYLVAVEAAGTAFEKRRGHAVSAYLAMNNEDFESAAAHFDNASQLNPIVLYWSAVVNQELGNLDKARDLADRAANRNTLNGNLPFFRSAAVALSEELATE
ncbi:MAG: tetratricopeptide repeat protein [Woeseiaceae bacterium]